MIKKVKSKIHEGFKSRRINVFMLFLLLSFVILLLTKLSKNYTNTFIFNIEKINVPEEEVVLNDSAHKLQISIKAHGFKLLRFHFFKPQITVDFSKNMEKTDSVYVWRKTKHFVDLSLQFKDRIDLVNIQPDSLVFRYDVNAVKMVPVKFHSNLQYKLGYDLASDFVVQPDSVKIIGPNILVSQINEIHTDTLSLDEVRVDFIKSLNLKMPLQDKNLLVSHSKVDVSAKVLPFTEGTLKIPVQVANIPDDITLKYFPKTVNVSYYTSLDNFSDITVEDFVVQCDYKKITDGEKYLIPEILAKPKDVKNVKIHQQHIEFIITE